MHLLEMLMCERRPLKQQSEMWQVKLLACNNLFEVVTK